MFRKIQDRSTWLSFRYSGASHKIGDSRTYKSESNGPKSQKSSLRKRSLKNPEKCSYSSMKEQPDFKDFLIKLKYAPKILS